MYEKFSLTLNVTMRPCQQRDLQDLEWFGMFTPHREIIRQAFERHEQGDNMMLVAEVNQFPVGQVWIDLAKRIHDLIGILWALRVMPPFQNLGIGTRLMTAAEVFLKHKGLAIAEIGVVKDNLNAKRLCERLGYRVIGDNVEMWSYMMPAGEMVHTIADEWIMHKLIRQR